MWSDEEWWRLCKRRIIATPVRGIVDVCWSKTKRPARRSDCHCRCLVVKCACFAKRIGEAGPCLTPSCPPSLCSTASLHLSFISCSLFSRTHHHWSLSFAMDAATSRPDTRKNKDMISWFLNSFICMQLVIWFDPDCQPWRVMWLY
jgi:hypothetical protein